MAEFTKGPWQYSNDPLQAVWATTYAGEMMVCQLRGWGHLTGTAALKLPERESAAIQDANGRLVSAAPELYEALLSIAESAADGRECPEWLQERLVRANAALAKAEGTVSR